MKKYLLGLFAIVIAIGFSAFTTVQPKTTQFLYGLNQEGDTYEFIDGITDLETAKLNCEADELPPCVVAFDTDPEVGSFPVNEEPIPIDDVSDVNGWYNE